MPKRGAVIRSDAAVAFVLGAGDQRMQRCGEAKRRGVRRHVMHAAVGQEDGAGHPVGRHIGERGAERGEEARAVGLAVRLSGLHRADFSPGIRPRRSISAARAASVCCWRSPKFWLGLLSTTTAATEVSGSRSSRVKDGLASASTIKRRAMVRTTAPRLRPNRSSAATISATASPPTRHRQEPAARRRCRNSCGSYCPSRSSKAGTWTWSAL